LARISQLCIQTKSPYHGILWSAVRSFPTLSGHVRTHGLTLQADDSPEFHPVGEGGLTLKAKKAPPGYSCLDGVQVWLTEGARSRNHKKTHRLTSL
jgi:hypothetical protein